jgi:hypothetical protein
MRQVCPEQSLACEISKHKSSADEINTKQLNSKWSKRGVNGPQSQLKSPEMWKTKFDFENFAVRGKAGLKIPSGFYMLETDRAFVAKTLGPVPMGSTSFCSDVRSTSQLPGIRTVPFPVRVEIHLLMMERSDRHTLR